MRARATAVALVRKGTPIGLIDRDAQALAEVTQLLSEEGATVASAAVDVTDREGLMRAVAEIASAIGPIEVLVACAGIGSLTQGADTRTNRRWPNISPAKRRSGPLTQHFKSSAGTVTLTSIRLENTCAMRG